MLSRVQTSFKLAVAQEKSCHSDLTCRNVYPCVRTDFCQPLHSIFVQTAALLPLTLASSAAQTYTFSSLFYISLYLALLPFLAHASFLSLFLSLVFSLWLSFSLSFFRPLRPPLALLLSSVTKSSLDASPICAKGSVKVFQTIQLMRNVFNFS